MVSRQVERQKFDIHNIYRAMKTMGTIPWFIFYVLLYVIVSVRDIVFAVAIGGLMESGLAQSTAAYQSYLRLLIVSVVVSVPLHMSICYADGRYTVFGTRRWLKDTFHKVAWIRQSEYERTDSSEILNRMTDDVFKVYDFLTVGLSRIVWSTLTFIVAIIYLAYMNAWLTMISYAVVPLLVLLLKKIADHLKKGMVNLSEKRAVSQQKAQEAIAQLDTVKSFTLEDYMLHAYQTAQQDVMSAFQQIRRRQYFIDAINQVVWVLPNLTLVMVGAYFVLNGHLTVAVLMVFLQIAGRAGGLMNFLGFLIADVKQADARLERIYSATDAPTERTGGQHPAHRPECVIRFKDVHFTYEGRESTIHDLSFDIQRGETVTVVGESGCGKSTLIKLIQGFFPLDKGSIDVMERKVDEMDLHVMRDQIAVVPQDPFLFSGTLRENIAFRQDTADDARIIKALDAAGLSDYQQIWEQGLDTVLIEHGDNVSGGQLQRIALARAIYRDTNVLLFDEVTSSLDYEVERAIYQSIEKLKNNHTMMIISHRLSTAKKSDRILVMKDGHIVEQGSHDDLMALQGEYAHLYQMEHRRSDDYE